MGEEPMRVGLHQIPPQWKSIVSHYEEWCVPVIIGQLGRCWQTQGPFTQARFQCAAIEDTCKTNYMPEFNIIICIKSWGINFNTLSYLYLQWLIIS